MGGGGFSPPDSAGGFPRYLGGFVEPLGGFVETQGGFVFADVSGASSFSLDMTTPTPPDGLVWTRSGSTMYPQLSASTSSTGIGNNLPVYEDRGGPEGGGYWLFETYTPVWATPFDMATGWTDDAGIIYTANTGTAPDGTVTADRIKDNDAAARAAKYRALTNTSGTFSIWVRDVAGDAPTAPGCIAVDQAPAAGIGTSLGAGTTWRRVRYSWSAAATFFTILPAGTQPGAVDNSKTGAIEVWGAMGINSLPRSRYFLPLCGGAATGQLTAAFSSTQLSSWFNGGVHHGRISFLPCAWARRYSQSSAIYWLWSMQTPNGRCSLRYTVVGPAWILEINGVDVLTTVSAMTGKPPTNLYWREDETATINTFGAVSTTDEVTVESYVTSGTGTATARVRVRINACVAFDYYVTGGTWTLAAPTSGTMGSDGTTANSVFHARFTKCETVADHSSMNNPDGEAATGLIFGDSTTGTNVTDAAVAIGICTVAESRAATPPRLVLIATFGDTLLGQKAKYDASQYATQNPHPRFAWIQLGINDITQGVSAATCTTRLQQLIDKVKADHPSITVFVGPPLAADATASMSAGEQAEWITYYNNIAGTGGTPITGATIVSAISLESNNNGSVGAAGVNTLKAIYEAEANDHIHENNALRTFAAKTIRAALNSAGISP